MKITKDLEGKTILMQYKTMFASINAIIHEVHVIRLSESGDYIEFRHINSYDTQWKPIDGIEILEILE